VSQLNQILERLADIEQTVVCTMPDGSSLPVTQAYAYLQWDIASAQCPFFANELNDWTSNIWAVGGGLGQHIDTTIPMYLCLQALEQNASLSLGVETAAANRDAVYIAFGNAVQLNAGLGQLLNSDGQTFVLEATITAGAVEPVTLGSTTYLAMRFALEVKEAFQVPVGM
jgi:hypothetical protein